MSAEACWTDRTQTGWVLQICVKSVGRVFHFLTALLTNQTFHAETNG